MHRVNTAIRELCGDTRLRRIITPAHARVIRISRVCVMAVGEFGIHQAHFANVTARDHRFHVTHEGIACVAVVHRADFAGFLGHAHDLFALSDGHRHRLFAQHMETRL